MSAWRRRVIETFPDLERELHGQFTPYTVFGQLLIRCREAHERGDEAELHRIYGFAEWCHRHRDRNLSNAAGVSFYEHLGDTESTRRGMARFVKPDIFEDVAQLLQSQMGAARFTRLKADYEHFQGRKTP